MKLVESINVPPALTEKQMLLVEYCQEIQRLKVFDQEQAEFYNFFKACLDDQTPCLQYGCYMLSTSSFVIECTIENKEHLKLENSEEVISTQVDQEYEASVVLNQLHNYSVKKKIIGISGKSLDELISLNKLFSDYPELQSTYKIENTGFTHGFIHPSAMIISHICYLKKNQPPRGVWHNMSLDKIIDNLIMALPIVKNLPNGFEVFKLTHSCNVWGGVDKDDKRHTSSYLWKKSMSPMVKHYGHLYEDLNLSWHSITSCEELFNFNGEVEKLSKSTSRGETTSTRFYFGHLTVSLQVYSTIMYEIMENIRLYGSCLQRFREDGSRPYIFRNHKSKWDYDGKIRNRLKELDYEVVVQYFK